MEDMLALKYPNLADKISKARNEGYTDKQIESFIRSRVQKAIYEGHAPEDVNSYLGITEESTKRLEGYVQAKRESLLAESFGTSPRDLKNTKDMAMGLGISPTFALANRDTLGNLVEASKLPKELATYKKAPERMADVAHIMLEEQAPEHIEKDAFSTENKLYYGLFARPYSALIERPAMGFASLVWDSVDKLWDVAEYAGIAEKGSVIGKTIDYYAQAYDDPATQGKVTPWVEDVRSQYRAANYHNSFLKGILGDLADASTDLASLILQIKTLGALGSRSHLVTGTKSVLPVQTLDVMKRVKDVTKLHGTHAFLTTPGTLEDRVEAGVYRIAYNLTPYVANAIGAKVGWEGLKVTAVDTALNTFLTSPTYVSAFKDAGGANKDFLVMALPQFVMDVGMAWHTRGEGPNPHYYKPWVRDNYAKTVERDTGRPADETKQILDKTEKILTESTKPVEVRPETPEGKSEDIIEWTPPVYKRGDKKGQYKLPKKTDLMGATREPATKVVEEIVGSETKVRDILSSRSETAKKPKEMLKWMVSKMQTADGPRVDVEYKERIRAIQDETYLTLRPKLSEKENVELDDALAKEYGELPVKYRDVSYRDIESNSHLAGMTVKDLMNRYNEIMAYREAGLQKTKEKEQASQREFDKNKKELLKPLKPEPEAGKIVKEKDKSFTKGVGKKVMAISQRGPRLFDTLDQGMKKGYKAFQGPFVRLFWDRANESRDTELRNKTARLTKMNKTLKKIGLTTKDLTKTRTLAGEKVSVDWLIEVYMASKNPQKAFAVLHSNFGGDEGLMRQAITLLTPKEKQLGDALLADYAENFARENDAVKRYTNESMEERPNYSPTYRMNQQEIGSRGYDGIADDIRDSLRFEKAIGKAYARKNFAKEMHPEYQVPLRLGAWENYTRNVSEREHFVAWGDAVRSMHRYLHDPDIADGIRRTHGNAYFEEAEKYINRLAIPNIYKAHDQIDSFGRALRQHASIAYLWGNLMTIAKQAPSLAFYTIEAGPVNMLGAMYDMVVTPRALLDFVNKNDPQMRSRMLERSLEEMKTSDPKAYNRMLKKIGKIGMQGIGIMDRTVTTIGWKAVYDTYINNGYSHQEAVRAAQRITLLTQPAAHAKDIAGLYAKSEFLNTFLMFTNQINQIWNMATHDVYAYAKGGEVGKAIRTTTAICMSAMMIQMLKDKAIPSDSEEWKELFVGGTLKSGLLVSLPLVGKDIVGNMEGFVGGSVLWSDAAVNTYKLAEDLVTWDVDSQTFRRAWETFAIATGTPYIGPKRITEAMRDANPWVLLGSDMRKERKKLF